MCGYKAGREFGRAVELGPIADQSYAFDCFQGRTVTPQNLGVPGDVLRATQNQRFAALPELCSKKSSKNVEPAGSGRPVQAVHATEAWSFPATRRAASK